jgi:hydrogenase expression/formation protein HypD
MYAEIDRLADRIGRRIQFMEVCGTHTVSIFRSGIRSMLPPNLEMISGPGCPVCVTAQRHIDAAIDVASRPGVIVATYGDMLRVPGRLGSLEQLRADGADVRVVNSARTALRVTMQNPDRSVVLLGVGFETTAPATAAVVLDAERDGIENFTILVSHKLVLPAMCALLEAGDAPLDGFLCPGHVSVIIGASAYRPIVQRYGRPCVVAGFEPGQILKGIISLLHQVADGRSDIENVYTATVTDSGNAVALDLLRRVFVVADTPWRALGVIPQSGLELSPRYRRFDAVRRFGVVIGEDEDHPACLCGQVIQGKARPTDCPLFGNRCTPLDPVGPCMVSSEGTCAAWHKYHRNEGRASWRG